MDTHDIEGMDLGKYVHSGRLETWVDILSASHQLVNIIHSAHFLPERVLHRDIRPSNIMLEKTETGSGWQVVVLDFDLSWHKGSYEKSVLFGSAMLGYLSPEQLEKNSTVSTRHSAVDAFGIGMTCFFMVSGRDPKPMEHQHPNWEETVKQACQKIKCNEWKSVPMLFSRIILKATRHDQNDRTDLPELRREIARVSEILVKPDNIRSGEIIAEEIASRSVVGASYRWNDDSRRITAELMGGRHVTLYSDESEKLIYIDVAVQAHEITASRSPKTWAKQKQDTVKDILRSDGWSVETGKTIPSGTVSVSAKIGVEIALPNIYPLAESIDRVTQELS